MKTLLIAGGGTGGHLYSGLAVAEQWSEKGGEVHFVGTRRGLETRIVPQFKFSLILMEVSPIKGKGLWHRFKTLIQLPKAWWHARSILKKIRPDVVLGIGGYVSGPVVWAATQMGIKTAVIDQNAIPGFTNRILGRWVDRIYLNFESASRFFKKEKVRVYGNPVIAKREIGKAPPLGEALLVCGGSQGAHFINEIFVQAVGDILKRFPNLEITHQTGSDDFGMMLKHASGSYKVTPYIEDMQDYYASSALIISRAGAGMLTELAIWGRPSILIPYPHATDDHQRMNAKVFVDHGAALVLEQSEMTAHRLAETVIQLLEDRERLQQMSQRARELAKPDAAKRVAGDLYV